MAERQRLTEKEKMLKALKLSTSNTALLVIDTQYFFCNSEASWAHGNEESETISKKIGRALPSFRKSGIDVYAVHTASTYQPARKDIDFYNFELKDTDKTIHKRYNSAFNMTALKKELAENKKQNLIVCGFNLSACVLESVKDACAAHFNVVVLKDLTGNNRPNQRLNKNEAIEDMIDAGARFATSREVLGAFKGRRP